MKNEKTENKTPSVSEQINIYLIDETIKDQLDCLKFGQITFEVRDGKVYRCLVSSSVLLK